jgi:hypothetical protein
MVITVQSLCAVTTCFLIATAPPYRIQNVVLRGKKRDNMVDRGSAEKEKTLKGKCKGICQLYLGKEI